MIVSVSISNSGCVQLFTRSDIDSVRLRRSRRKVEKNGTEYRQAAKLVLEKTRKARQERVWETWDEGGDPRQIERYRVSVSAYLQSMR